MEKLVSSSERSPGNVELLATAYARARNRTEALRLIDELKQRRQKGYIPAGALINPYLGLGEYDQAFFWFEEAYKEQSNILQFLKVHPFFDPVRGDPPFRIFSAALALTSPGTRCSSPEMTCSERVRHKPHNLTHLTSSPRRRVVASFDYPVGSGLSAISECARDKPACCRGCKSPTGKENSDSILASSLAGYIARCLLKRRPEVPVGRALELRKADGSGCRLPSEMEEGNTAATLLASGCSVLRSLKNPRTLRNNMDENPEISSAPWSCNQGRSAQAMNRTAIRTRWGSRTVP